MMPKKFKIDTITNENIKIGKNICKHNHRSVDGQIYRVTIHGHCFGCYFNLPEGEYTNSFPEVQPKEKKPPKFTEEEAKKKRSVASMKWNAKNPDKRKEYQRKYEAKKYAKKKLLKQQLLEESDGSK